MKNLFSFALVCALVVTLGHGFAFAGQGNNGLSGPHWGFNIIGHPKNVDVLKNDNSNGRAIMVPLKNAKGPDAIVCEEDEVVITPDEEPTFQDQKPAGAKIYFTSGDHFEIIDRDATDNNGAEVMVPTETADGDTILSVDIWAEFLENQILVWI